MKKPNRFFPVMQQDIQNAENQLGFSLPSSLKGFYYEVGYGFLMTSRIGQGTINVNRIMDPESIADVFSGDPSVAPEEGFAKDEIPFFDLGERLYLVLLPNGEVAFPWGGKVVAESLEEFIERLYYQDPEFYHKNL